MKYYQLFEILYFVCHSLLDIMIATYLSIYPINLEIQFSDIDSQQILSTNYNRTRHNNKPRGLSFCPNRT